MLNNIVINNLFETDNKSSKKEVLPANISKIESSFKLYFRKYIDNKKSGVTLIGPPSGSNLDPNKKLELIENDAKFILNAYIKEIFGENKNNFEEISNRLKNNKDLVSSKKLLQNVYNNINKQLSKLQQSKIDNQARSILKTSPSNADFYTSVKTTEKVPAPGDLYDKEGNIDKEITKSIPNRFLPSTKEYTPDPSISANENEKRQKLADLFAYTNPWIIFDKESKTGFSRIVKDKENNIINKILDVPASEYYATSHIGVPSERENYLNNEQHNVSIEIENLEREISANNRENESIHNITTPYIDKYVIKVLNISESGTTEWPNSNRRPPVSNLSDSPLQKYKLALKAKDFDQIKENYSALEENASPIFSDYFGLYEQHLEGIIDKNTGKNKFPQLQILNLIVSRLIYKLYSLANKSDLIKQELKNINSASLDKDKAFHTTEANKEILNRTIKSISENEIIAFHNLFISNKYATIGKALSEAENIMYSAIQKNLNAIDIFLENNKATVIEYVNSLKQKILKYNQAEPLNKYEIEFKDIGLNDALESQSSLLAKKWRERFEKIPPIEKPFKEIFNFMKLVDTKFKDNVNSKENSFKVTSSEAVSSFFNPVMFLLTLVDNTDLLNDPKIDIAKLIKSNWGKDFRNYMGAQKIGYSSPREDLSVLVDINKFMREGFINPNVENPTSELGKRLQTVANKSTDVVNNSAGLQLLSGDKDKLINTREFLDKLKTELPKDYYKLIFSELYKLRKEIILKKNNKEYEEASVLYEGPYQKALENVISLLSPIFREFIFERYSQDTRLTETTKLFYAMTKQFKKLIEKFNPDNGQDVEDYLWAGLYEFNKTEKIRAMHNGSARLWFLPQTNENVLTIMNSILDVAEIREMHRKESYHKTSEITDKPSTFNSDKHALSTIKYLSSKKYEEERKRAVKINGKYYVTDVAEKDIVQYTIEPKNSAIRNPEEAAKLIAKIWRTLEAVFSKKLQDIGLYSKENEEVSPKHYLDQIKQAISSSDKEKEIYYSNSSSKDRKDKAKVVEPIASDDKDAQNQYTTVKSQGKSLLEKDHQIMELLSIASVLFDSINLDEDTFMKKVGNNIFSILDEEIDIVRYIKAVVSYMFKKQWDKVHSILFKQIGKVNNSIKWVDAQAISQKTRNSIKPPLVVVLGVLLATSANLIKETSALFKENEQKSLIDSGIFSKLGVDGLYSSYSRVLDSLKELLNSAFLHKVASSRPNRGFPSSSGRGRVEKGEKSVMPFNMDNRTSIRSPWTLLPKWQKMASGLGEEFVQNQDPTSDSRQQAMVATQNALNRFMYNLQEYYKGEREEVNTSNLIRDVGNSIDAEIKSSFKDLYRSRKFGNTSWKNRELDSYHNKIIKKLRSSIEDLGYKVNRPEWFTQNENLRSKAIEIIEKDIKKHFIDRVMYGNKLYGPGDLESAGKGTTVSSNPLYRKNSNPSSRLVGDEGSAYDIQNAETGFAGNTAKTMLSKQQIQADADRRLQQFIEIYPQFLEQKSQILISMFEPKTVENESTLENTLELASKEEDTTSLTIAVHEFDNILDNCFTKIGKEIDINKKFVKAYKDLDESETKLINFHIIDLGQKIEDAPLSSKKYFNMAINFFPNIESKRDRYFREILFMKYFEYIYTREILLSETILYLMNIENENKAPNEPKIESIEEFLQLSNISIYHIPGIEYKMYRKDNTYNKISIVEMLKQIFNDRNLLKTSNFLEIANELVGYITGNTDISTSSEVETFGMSSKSNTRTDIHGIDATKQGKQEKSKVSAIDKQMFDKLKIQNISKLMHRILKNKDKDTEYTIDTSYDKFRTYIRDLVSLYNTPNIDTQSKLEIVVDYISSIRDKIINIRHFILSSANAIILTKANPYERKELLENMNKIINSYSYDRENILKFKKDIYKLIIQLYNFPVAEEEDYDSFDMITAKEKLQPILNELKKASKADNKEFIGQFNKQLSEVIKSLGKLLKNKEIEGPEKTISLLIDKKGLLLTLIELLKTTGKKPLEEDIYFKVINNIDQVIEKITELLKVNDSSVKKRYKDPNADKILPQDKASKGTYKSFYNDELSKEDQAIVKKLTKENKSFEPFREAIIVNKVLKCIKNQSNGTQRVSYEEYSKNNPGKLSKILFELSKQSYFDLDNYRIFITEDIQSKANIVFEFSTSARNNKPEYIWVVSKQSVSSN